jgi:hypothetical protein
LEKNTIGCAKIDTLQGKVRRSREKIDQILNDLQIYQTEYETILVNKKSRPVKLKVSRQITEIRVECYKNYLLHLQSVIEILEREIRGFKTREKEHKKLAKIAGVGVQQKHNTYADQLKIKILMLERQIVKEIGSSQVKEVSEPKKKIKVKSKIMVARKQAKSVVRTLNAGKDLKNAKTELKERDDQVSLLKDMLRSSAHESQMKDKDITRLQKKLRILGSKSRDIFKGATRLAPLTQQNKTENAFLPGSLKGSVRTEAGFPNSYISGGGSSFSNPGGLPSVRGAYQYTDEKTSRNDDGSRRSQSQISAVTPKKRVEKIVEKNRRKLDQNKNVPENMYYERVTAIEPVRQSEEIINVQIREEDSNLEEGTMRIVSDHQKPIIPDAYENENDSEFEEGYPDDYNNDDI